MDVRKDRVGRQIKVGIGYVEDELCGSILGYNL